MEFYRGGHPDIDVSDDQQFPARDEGAQIGQYYHDLFCKDSAIVSINNEQAVVGAICFGWIDSQIRSYDHRYYMHKFGPRRANSK